MAWHNKIILCVFLLHSAVVKSEVVYDELSRSYGNNLLPVAINTWAGKFCDATAKAYEVITEQGSRLDAIEQGCHVCEVEQCDGSVGYGGSPDESGQTTLDAMIMDGVTHKATGVGNLKKVKAAISVARYAFDHTQHSLLVGEDATKFAKEMGFQENSLTTNVSKQEWEEWKKGHCQPNYWMDVRPAAKTSCGPYKPRKDGPAKKQVETTSSKDIRFDNHDTIAMAVIDANGDIACGTSTNGLSHKIDGRVGDSPIAGAGCYADNEVGAAGATGDGDVMMRFLPTYQAVENMRHGMSPTEAAQDAIDRIAKYYPQFVGALFAINKKGEYGGAVNNWTFEYSVRNPTMKNVTVYTVHPHNM